MAKRIDLGVPGVRLNETGHRALRLIAERAREQNRLACVPVRIGRREFGPALGLSETSVIRACHLLEQAGLIVTEGNRLESGAQVANSYALTALGIEVLRLADIAVAEGRVGTR